MIGVSELKLFNEKNQADISWCEGSYSIYSKRYSIIETLKTLKGASIFSVHVGIDLIS